VRERARLEATAVTRSFIVAQREAMAVEEERKEGSYHFSTLA